MGRPSDIEKVLETVFRENGIGGDMLFEGGHDFDLGLEIALLWLDKLCEHLVKPGRQGGILKSVKAVFKNEWLVLLQKTGDTTEIAFSDIRLSRKYLIPLCRSGGFYEKLASIRFTRCFDDDSRELASLPDGHPRIRKALAVPVFINGVPSGCLALLSESSDRRFCTTHAMVLSLAASILSVARTFDELREKLTVGGENGPGP